MLLTAASLFAACSGGGGGTGNNPTLVIARTAANDGNAQADTVKATLANPLRVVVTENGTAKAGVNVTWATTAAASSVTGNGATDANGIATASWTLGSVAGVQSATATLAGASGSPVGFTATAGAGAAVSIAKTSGDQQGPLAGFSFGSPLVVTVRDQFTNPVSGVSVDWAVTGGDASLVGGATVQTGGNGQAAKNVNAGPTAGPIAITATAGSLTGSPVTFNATSVAVPTAATVNTNGVSYVSARNNSSNPAVDTLKAGGTVTWNGLGNGAHLVRSTGSPSFTTQTVNNPSYQFTFQNAGTYSYDCAIHGQLMTGSVVVVP